MARIRSARTADGKLVTVSGRLTALDMGRLERACSSALTSYPPALEIDLRLVTHTDRTAATLLRHLADRGVVVTGASQL